MYTITVLLTVNVNSLLSNSSGTSENTPHLVTKSVTVYTLTIGRHLL